MKLRAFSMLVLVLVLSLLTISARADTFGIGDAGVYAVLGQAGVTNTGSSVIHGDVGGSAGTPTVGGFPPGIVLAPSVILTGSATAFSDATTAYTTAQALGGASDVGVTDLTGLTLGVGLANNLAAGVYEFDTTAGLSGLLTLDAGGSSSANWVFQIGSALTTDSGSGVQIINAGAPGAFTGSVTWAVGSAATLGTTTTFLGTIISQAGGVLNTSATIGCGRVVSLDASVTLDTNVIDTPANCMVTAGTGGTGGTITATTPTATPEPGTFALLSSGLLAMVFLRFRKSRVSSLI